jgi:hypothetical protein
MSNPKKISLATHGTKNTKDKLQIHYSKLREEIKERVAETELLLHLRHIPFSELQKLPPKKISKGEFE